MSKLTMFLKELLPAKAEVDHGGTIDFYPVVIREPLQSRLVVEEATQEEWDAAVAAMLVRVLDKGRTNE